MPTIITQPGAAEWRIVPMLDDQGVVVSSQYLPFTPTNVQADWAPQPGSQEEFLNCPIFEVLYEGNRGGGKGLLNSEQVLTDSGWKRAGDVTTDDRFVAMDGSFTDVVAVYPQGEQQLFQVTFDDGVTVVTDSTHRWLVRDMKQAKRPDWFVRTTYELLHKKGVYCIPTMTSPAPGPRWEGPDPYTLGLILGDGTLTGCYVTVYGHEDDEEIKAHLVDQGFTVKQYKPKCFHAYQTTCQGGEQWRDALGRHIGDQKQVPQELLNADPDARLAVLQGLMDADGSVDAHGRCTFSTVSPWLRDAVAQLTHSLGGKAAWQWKPKSAMRRGGYWRVTVMHCNKFVPFRLTRKTRRVKQMKGVYRRIKSIEPCGIGRTTCFAVADPSKTFITTKAFIVTHNTECLLMDFAQWVGRGWGKDWKGILFRHTYKQLKDVQDKSLGLFKKLWPDASFNLSKMEWSWPTGEQLLLRHMSHKSDYLNYHGHAYPWIGWEELTTWPDDELYLRMMSTCRSTNPLVHRRVRATTNPYGPGFNWVKHRFRLPLPDGATLGEVIEDEDQSDRMSIRSDLKENRVLMHADPTYLQQLKTSARSPAELQAWIYGSWDIQAGGMFDDIWIDCRKYAVIPAFKVPESWRIDTSFDWGNSRPFAVCWWAQSDGTPYRREDGSSVPTVRGDLFLIHEWYGWTGKPNEGRRLLAGQISRGMVERQLEWGINGRVRMGVADASIFDREATRDVTIASDMAKPVLIDSIRYPGIRFQPSDKRRGSRKQGWEQIRKRLAATVPPEHGLREEKGLFVFERCQQFLRTVPTLPRDPDDLDDVDTEAEDHMGDAVRYRVRKDSRTVGSGRIVGMY